MKLNIEPGLLVNLAKTYQSSSRILMEYIDNSLDSAEDLFNKNNSVYPYTIKINIRINKEDKSITVEDNCKGMDLENLKRLIENIGDSNKKTDFITNGQFGFGVHAFLAFAEKIQVKTHTKNSRHGYEVELSKEVYKKNLDLPEPKAVSKRKFDYSSGTVVTITNIEKDWWKEITANELRDEIERHFERLLGRDNLEVRIYVDNEFETCKPFDYETYLGTPISHTIKEFELNGLITKPPFPLVINLRITEDIIPNKRPIFVNKGRRIEEVQIIKSFRNKSKFRTGLWGHGNLTGYIEVNGMVSPTISRDDFERSRNRTLVYNELVKLESEINEALQEINKKSEDASLNKFQDLLSNELSKLARADLLRFRTQYSVGDEHNVGKVEKSDDKISGAHISSGGTGSSSTGSGNGEGVTTGDDIPIVVTEDENDRRAGSTKRSGFDIEFSDAEQRLSDGTLLRSNFIPDGPIVVYKSHPDFKERVKRTYQGDMKITDRLISYLALEIAIQYKDRFFAVRGKQPEVQAIANSRKDTFINLIEFAYNFEEALQPYVNRSLITLESTEETED